MICSSLFLNSIYMYRLRLVDSSRFRGFATPKVEGIDGSPFQTIGWSSSCGLLRYSPGFCSWQSCVFCLSVCLLVFLFWFCVRCLAVWCVWGYSRWRPYRVEYTGSLPNSEVNRRRARSVLDWGTVWEHPWVPPAFIFFIYPHFSHILETVVWVK